MVHLYIYAAKRKKAAFIPSQGRQRPSPPSFLDPKGTSRPDEAIGAAGKNGKFSETQNLGAMGVHMDRRF